jgi:hypothetical protein
MPSRFQQMLHDQRQNPETSRAGLKWDDVEDNQMLSLLSSGKSLADIAKTLQRTEGSIRTRLIIYAIGKMEKDNLSIEQVSEMVHLTPEDINEYQNKKHARDERAKQRQSNKKMSKRPSSISDPSNSDIYELLLGMNKLLERLLKQ